MKSLHHFDCVQKNTIFEKTCLCAAIAPKRESWSCPAKILMNEKHIVTAVDSLGNHHISTLLAKKTNDACELTLRNDGWRQLVKGAARNVWASGMSRSMGGGIKAYKLEKGIAASLDRMVNIFEAADEAEVGTFAEQQAFFWHWFPNR